MFALKEYCTTSYLFYVRETYLIDTLFCYVKSMLLSLTNSASERCISRIHRFAILKFVTPKLLFSIRGPYLYIHRFTIKKVD